MIVNKLSYIMDGWTCINKLQTTKEKNYEHSFINYVLQCFTQSHYLFYLFY